MGYHPPEDELLVSAVRAGSARHARQRVSLGPSAIPPSTNSAPGTDGRRTLAPHRPARTAFQARLPRQDRCRPATILDHLLHQTFGGSAGTAEPEIRPPTRQQPRPRDGPLGSWGNIGFRDVNGRATPTCFQLGQRGRLSSSPRGVAGTSSPASRRDLLKRDRRHARTRTYDVAENLEKVTSFARAARRSSGSCSASTRRALKPLRRHLLRTGANSCPRSSSTTPA